MCHPEFGKDAKPEEALDKLVKSPKRLCSTEAQMVLRDHYENDYGIYAHAKQLADHPFALVLQHWCEDTITNGPLYDRTKKFIDLEVTKYTGLSLNAFLELPTYHCEMILRICADKIKSLAPLIDEAARAFQQAQHGSR